MHLSSCQEMESEPICEKDISGGSSINIEGDENEIDKLLYITRERVWVT